MGRHPYHYPACANFAGIAASRFLLGFVEAVVNLGFVLMMSIWFKAEEQRLRLESYYCTNGIATMFGGLIGYATGHMTTGLPRWMCIFIIFGTCPITMGIMALVCLSDLPSPWSFSLTPKGLWQSIGSRGTDKASRTVISRSTNYGRYCEIPRQGFSSSWRQALKCQILH